MGKLNFENLEPNRNGILVGNNSIIVYGYNLKRKIQTFFDEKENLTCRVRGIDMPNGHHYLINEEDIEYIKSSRENEWILKIKRAYLVVKYNEKKRIVCGNEVSRKKDPVLLEDISKKIDETFQ